MSDWNTIDTAVAWEEDESLSSALLQRTAQNGAYLHEHHTRATSITYETGSRPLLCGAVKPGDGTDDTDFERVAIPYLWEPVGENSNGIEIVVSIKTVIPSGTGSFKLNCVWEELDRFSRIPRSDAHSGTEVVLVSAGDTFQTFNLDISSHRSGRPIVIWITGESTETSTPGVNGSALVKIRGRTVETDSPDATVVDDLRPTRVAYFYGDPSKQGESLPNRRQVIRQEKGRADITTDDIVHLWPPVGEPYIHEGVGASAAPQLQFVDLTSVEIYGLSIRSTPDPLEPYGSKLSAGQGPGSSAAQYLYRLASDPWLTRTIVHAAGAPPDDSDLDIYDAATPVNTAYPSLLLALSAAEVSSCFMQFREIFESSQNPGAPNERVEVRVRALIAMTLGPRHGQVDSRGNFQDGLLADTNRDVIFNLMSTHSAGFESGQEVTVTFNSPMGQDSRLDKEIAEGPAALLDLKRGIVSSANGFRASNKEHHANTLSGAMPESVWGRTSYTFVDLSMEVSVTGESELSLRARMESPVPEGARIHMLSWLVTGQEYSRESEVKGIL